MRKSLLLFCRAIRMYMSSRQGYNGHATILIWLHKSLSVTLIQTSEASNYS